MRETFTAFLEIFFLDATYKLLDLQFPVYLFVREDANGASEIIGMGILVAEDEESVKLLIETFKSKNPAVMRTRFVMADKDINERDMIKVLICLRTSRQEVTTEEMSITSGQRHASLEFILKMAYAKTEEECTGIYNQSSVALPEKAKAYFDKNWHPNQRRMGYEFQLFNR